MEEQGYQICWEDKAFPNPLEEFQRTRGCCHWGSCSPQRLLPCCEGGFFAINRNVNRNLRGYPADSTYRNSFRVSSAITDAVQSSRRLHQDKRGSRSQRGMQTPFCRTAELAFPTSLRGAQQRVMICRAACFAHSDNKVMSLALFFPLTRESVY